MDPIKNITYITTSTINRLKFHGFTMAEHYDWLETVAIEFYQDMLKGFNAPSIESVLLKLNASTRVWVMPADCIDYTKICLKQGNELYLVTGNPDLMLGEDLCSGPVPVADYVNENGSLCSQQSTSGTTELSYRIDKTNRCIVFSENIPPCSLVIEYLSSGRNVNGSTLIHPGYMEAFRRYLKWQCYELTPKLVNLAQQAKAEYSDMLYDSNTMVKTESIHDYRAIIYGAPPITLG